MSTETSHLKSRAFSGFVWAYGSFFGNKVLAFGATLVLARLLAPAQFGVVAFALAVISYVENVADLGLGSALVQRADADEPVTIATAFWAGLAIATALTLTCFFAAPLIARVGPSGSVAAMFRVLSLQFVISALANPQKLLMQRHLQFRRLALPVWAGALAKAATSIALAVSGAGAWSLIWGQLAGTVVTAVVLYTMSPWRPRLLLSGPRLREMLRYGSGIAVVGVVGEAVTNADYIIVGARLGGTALGLYVLAFRIPELVIASGFRVANEVFFPFYARLRDRDALRAADGHDAVVDDELRRGYLLTLRLGALVALPIGFLMAALARPIVLTLYGDDWHGSIAPLAFIALWAASASLTTLPGVLFKAVGRSWILTANALLELAMILPVLWIAADHGITAVAIAHTVVNPIFLVVLALVVRRIIGVTLRKTFLSIVPGLLVGAATGLAALGPAHNLPPAAGLLVGGLAGTLVYAGVVRMFLTREFREVTALIARSRRGAADRVAVESPQDASAA